MVNSSELTRFSEICLLLHIHLCIYMSSGPVHIHVNAIRRANRFTHVQKGLGPMQFFNS